MASFEGGRERRGTTNAIVARTCPGKKARRDGRKQYEVSYMYELVNDSLPRRETLMRLDKTIGEEKR